MSPSEFPGLFLLSLVFPPFFVQAQSPPSCTGSGSICISAVSSPTAPITVSHETGKVEVAAAGSQLVPGDKIVSQAGDGLLELFCDAATSLSFSRAFEVLILPPGAGETCAINLVGGEVIATTESQPRIVHGNVTLGSPHTIYGLEVAGADAPPITRVYSGDVEVSSPLGRQTVSSQQKLVGARGTPVEMTASDFNQAATVLTGVLAAKAGSRGQKLDEVASADALRTYISVLQRPTDAQARLDLAVLEVRHSVTDTALIHLTMAEKLSPARSSQAAVIQFARAAAYQVRGDTELSRQLQAAALRIDPDVKRQAGPLQIMALHQTEPAQPGPVKLELRASATPSAVAVGQATRIEVIALAPGNWPLPGVSITIAAGGGAFSESRSTRIEGITDAQGRFAAHWSCRPCAPSYGLSIQAARTGLEPASAEVSVPVR